MLYKKHVHAITTDNGQKFAYHGKIAKDLDVKIDFAYPYFSC
ncbi:hypothetical protein BTN49_3203 [Candidatus Enterovibrio escicola]|uniref:Mobile element protein n=1 Tax=Candidatus Enterovibrio escicola TaxID=1927127 RepID=A0A2A5SZG6_9GAMM|nr:hypothetical protein BTN49_3203 [Candidatus Enterovibrio escacola]